jgi:hypothetical protein
MKHPKNKLERNCVASTKGLRRVKALASYQDVFGGWRGEAERIAVHMTSQFENKRQFITASAQRLRHTTKACSCVSCGNPRRHFGERTLQERRAA